MNSADANREALVTTYEEVCRSYERIDDFRAKLLGFLPVVSGAGFFLLLGREGSASGDCSDSGLLAVAGAFGAVVTLGLFCYEARGIQRCVALVTVGQHLESQMGVEGRFRQWPHSLVRRMVNEPFASGLIYSAMLSAWLYVALVCSSVIAAVVVAGIALALGVWGARKFYWRVTNDERLQHNLDRLLEKLQGSGDLAANEDEAIQRIRFLKEQARLPHKCRDKDAISASLNAVRNAHESLPGPTADWEAIVNRVEDVLAPSPPARKQTQGDRRP